MFRLPAAGTPYGVSDVQLENTGSADTIKVLFAPPSVDIVFLSGNQGSYRCVVLVRLALCTVTA